MTTPFEIFLQAPPGLEQPLADEVRAAGFPLPRVHGGGVSFMGGWPDAWRANLELRGAGRVLARIGSFRAFHLAQLDKRARKFPWAEVLRPDVPLRVEVTTRKSKIYHAKAAQQRIERAISETLGAPLADEAALTLKVRIDDNLVTFSVDTSGVPLHKRGHKEAVGKAPMRETMAALFLRQMGYGGDEPVLDPMCGSGTFVIEAAEMALGLMPGRSRRFAFEDLASFDPEAWAAMKSAAVPGQIDCRFFGSDRDSGAIRMSTANADRAGVAAVTRFEMKPVGDLIRPDGPPGLVIVNPPYGARIGNLKPLYGLHGSLGAVLKERFSGWRVGLITSEAKLAHATGLPFHSPGPPVAHGGLKVKLYRTDALP
ncbi:THUMP domain-containing class I SAM-dependent RNA methyltransferase [Salibaculum griseiflavum]|uniref:RNA methyltransferase n=1 Tax=Salibaculum griseiflavum TaxID=1914409 RepID=A0A2V1P367_9RHOB|nr:RNA methyltransferase [Salibaculum griseiflavum]PWG16264.1 RNA methyltransferase [Salibaculum griseiflavum]